MMIRHRNGIEKVLIVTPASLKYNWVPEIEKWTDESYVVIDGPAQKRMAQWRQDVFFTIVNYELLLQDLFGGKSFRTPRNETNDQKRKRLVAIEKSQMRARVLGNIRRRKWGFVCMDEAHHARNRKSKKFNNLSRLRANYKMALTGTPLDGSLEQIHSLMGIVAPGLLQSQDKFLKRHAIMDANGRILKYVKVQEVRDRIAPFFLRRMKTDVWKDRPERSYVNRQIVLTDKEMKVYKDLANNVHEMTEDAELLELIVRCKQFCDVPDLVDDTIGRGSKMIDFCEIMGDIVSSGNGCLVFSQYAKVIEVIKRELNDIGIETYQIIGDTPKEERVRITEKLGMENEPKVVLGTSAMTEGLNFQKGASYVVLYDEWWGNCRNEQAIDRCYRIGQKKDVTVIRFFCRGTIEDRIREVLVAKKKVTVDALGDNVDNIDIMKISPKELAKLL
jgi:SNF2 family DNA or RNA helicase